jgi:tetratricopeptide (TPR) repeat protein
MGLILLSASVLWAQSTFKYQEIETLIQAGKLSEAEMQLERRLSHSPQDATAHMLLGIVYDEKKERIRAGKELEESVRLKPRDPAFHINLGRYYAEGGNLVEAKKEFQYALKLDPGNGLAHSSLGLVLMRTGHLDPAEAEFEAALASNHRDLATLLNLFKVQLSRKKFMPARQTASEIRRYAPPSAELYDDMGAMQATAGDYTGAISNFERANEIKPGSYKTQFNLGLAYYRANDLARAATVLQAAARANDTAELENLLGEIYEAEQEYLKAVQSFQKAAEMDPRNESYRFDFIVELLAHHNFKAAILISKPAVNDFPDSQRIRLALGAAEFGQGQFKESLQTFLETARKFPDAQLPLYFLASASDATAQEQAETQSLLETYIQKHPEQAWPFYYLGRFAIRSGPESAMTNSLRRAEMLLQRSIQLDPHFADSHLELGNVYIEEKNYPAALAELKEATRLDPDLSDAHYKLFQLYRRDSNKAEANRELQVFEKLKAEDAKHNMKLNEVHVFLYKLRQ